ncbi:MAG: metal ABC transporter ATP-binding protein [Bacteroidia bacterium]|nr:metal ABC transporter ATP-binding protein [Bacteroidia bacterium]
MIKQVPDPVLELHNLTVVYESKPALWNVDYTIPENHLIGVVGPNGSGKSTMLKALMGLVKPSSGYAHVYGKEIDEVRQRIAYVPQRNSVDWDFPVNVFDAVLMGRYKANNLFRRVSKADKEIAMEAIKKVQLEPFVKRQISQLSGGQQQRVFIARALAQEADMYLLDEPFAGVDAATENSIMSLLKEMNANGKTILVVHHDLQSVKDYFDWLLLMNTRLIASGPTEEVFTEDMLQKTYGGKLNILSRVVEIIEKQGHPIREK